MPNNIATKSPGLSGLDHFFLSTKSVDDTIFSNSGISSRISVRLVTNCKELHKQELCRLSNFGASAVLVKRDKRQIKNFLNLRVQAKGSATIILG